MQFSQSYNSTSFSVVIKLGKTLHFFLQNTTNGCSTEKEFYYHDQTIIKFMTFPISLMSTFFRVSSYSTLAFWYAILLSLFLFKSREHNFLWDFLMASL